MARKNNETIEERVTAFLQYAGDAGDADWSDGLIVEEVDAAARSAVVRVGERRWRVFEKTRICERLEDRLDLDDDAAGVDDSALLISIAARLGVTQAEARRRALRMVARRLRLI